MKVDLSNGTLSAHLGVVGMPGRTAYFGLLEVGKPVAGETLVVAAASGAVGSVVGQIAKILGLRVIGIAGGEDKCRYVREELGFDDCLDYKTGNLSDKLKAACPNGIDIYFENVGGDVTRAVAPLLNPGARVPICGYISNYNDQDITQAETPFHILKKLPTVPEHRFLWSRSGRIAGNRPPGSWVPGSTRARSNIASPSVRGLKTHLSCSGDCCVGATLASSW